MMKNSHVVLHPDEQDKLDVDSIMKIFYTFGISNGVKILHSAWKHSLKIDITISKSIDRIIIENTGDK